MGPPGCGVLSGRATLYRSSWIFGGEPVDPADAVARFLRSIGGDPATLPQSLAERAARYRALLAGRRVLVVLDNARAAEQVRPLLPGSPLCAVLVTSRDSLTGLVSADGATSVGLDVLSIGGSCGAAAQADRRSG